MTRYHQSAPGVAPQAQAGDDHQQVTREFVPEPMPAECRDPIEWENRQANKRISFYLARDFAAGMNIRPPAAKKMDWEEPTVTPEPEAKPYPKQAGQTDEADALARIGTSDDAGSGHYPPRGAVQPASRTQADGLARWVRTGSLHHGAIMRSVDCATCLSCQP